MVDHGQHFAGLYVENDQAAGLGLVLHQGVAQLAVRQVLQAQVDGQCQLPTRLGVARHPDILDQPPATILEHLALPRHACQPLLEGQLDPLATLVIDIGEADHVRRDLARRVEPAKLLEAVDAGDLVGEHRVALLGSQAARQIEELAPGILLQTPAQHFGILAQGSRQRRPLLTLAHQFLGIAPQGDHRGADRQRLAVAVGDQPAVRGNRDVPHAACIAVGLEEVMVEHVQVDDAPGDHADHAQQDRDHQAEAPGVECAVEVDHGATIRTSPGSGMRICSCSLASVSMRL
ncbi:hypothetical protein D3C85_297090 [compost metagenome]